MFYKTNPSPSVNQHTIRRLGYQLWTVLYLLNIVPTYYIRGYNMLRRSHLSHRLKTPLIYSMVLFITAASRFTTVYFSFLCMITLKLLFVNIFATYDFLTLNQNKTAGIHISQPSSIIIFYCVKIVRGLMHPKIEIIRLFQLIYSTIRQPSSSEA